MTADPLSILMPAVGRWLLVASLLPSSGRPSVDAPAQSDQPAHDWAWRGRYWQISAPEGEDAAAGDSLEGTRGLCPPGMVSVNGAMKVDGPEGSIEELQKATCTRWISRSFPERCAAFDEDAWRVRASALPTRAMSFCIDRFEYPNRRGAYPAVAVTWSEAGDLCRERGERLCTEDEWTFACEGVDALPYPTGYLRDPEACVVDRPWRSVHEERLRVRGSPTFGDELDALWQGEPSGSRPRCRSPFGVYDLTGNVDEWTASVQKTGFRSILKGGYWGPVRTRCRPSTRAHEESFYFYQQGFRCCRDAPASELDTAREESPE